MTNNVRIFVLLALAPIAANAAEQTFTKTINLRDRLDLAITTGAGNILISQGPAGRLTITGHVKANDWHATDDRIRDIAAAPPIQQNGSSVRIGGAEQMSHVIIDYEIEAPADSLVQASAGAGDIADEGVGQNARLNSGSGSIHALELQGGLTATTNQGDIEVEQVGQGEVKVMSNSGNLEIRNLHGALHAITNAGNIRVSGKPAGDWSVQTGKGDIDLTLGNVPCTIDAQTGAGLVLSDLRVQGEKSPDLRHLAGQINGGGHNVTLQAGEGEIHIR
jgi:hypothetical protein